MKLKNLSIKFEDQTIEIPYWIIGGNHPGKTIFISGGIHGDEVNGVYATSEVLEMFKEDKLEEKMKGTVYVFPVLNPTGFAKSKRVVPEDGKDLNRQFNHETPESISHQIARTLTDDFLSKCDMGIDFHDAGEGAHLLPHARIHRNDEDDCVSCSRELARVFGTEYLLERDGLSSMMAVALNNKHNTPVITVEIGGSQILHPDLISIVRRGVTNVLSAYRMIDGELDLPAKQTAIYRRDIIQSKNSGVIRFAVELGDRVAVGDTVAYMNIPSSLGEVVIKSPKEGVIFSLWQDNLMVKGRTMFSIVCVNSSNQGDVIEMENYTVKPFNL